MSELPSGWLVKTLGEVAVWGSGGTPQAGNPTYYGGSIPWAIIGDLNDGVVSSTEKSITEDGLANSSAKLVPTGAILIAMYGSIGKMGIAGVPMATNQAIAFALPNQDLIVPAYLYWFLSSQRELFLSQGKGATQQNISQTLLKAWRIPVPPLEEQRRIVETLGDHLSRLDKALVELHAGQQLLKAATRSLLHKVINGSGSPKKLSELCSLITDGSHFSPKTVSQGFPYITVRDISDDEIDFDGCKYISGESYAELEKNGCRPLPNDVLFSKDGTVGKVTVVSSDKPFVVLSSLAILRPDQEKVLPSFLKLALKSPMVLENALGMKTGTAIRRVVLRNLKNLEIDVPPLEQQVQLVEYVDTQLQAFSKIDKALQSQVGMLGVLRRSLLNAAFSGQLLEGR